MSIAEVLEGRARWAVEHGEALELLHELPDESVDAVVTDPPYSSGGAFKSDRTAATGDKYVGDDVARTRPDFAGDTRDQRAFAYWTAMWLAECLRVARPGAPLVVFTDWRQLPSVTDAVQAGGWVWRGIVPWNKTEGVRPVKGRFRAQCEYAVIGSAGPMPLRDDVGALPGFYTVSVRQSDKHHQTGKPSDLMADLCRVCPPGGVVLDPFAGSASTGVGALRTGRRFVGFEKRIAYVGISVARLALAEEQPPVEPMREAS